MYTYLIVHARFRQYYNLILTRSTEVDASFHTSQLNFIRPSRIVIRHLHSTTTQDDIIVSLSDLGRHVTHVHDVKRFSDK